MRQIKLLQDMHPHRQMCETELPAALWSVSFSSLGTGFKLPSKLEYVLLKNRNSIPASVWNGYKSSARNTSENKSEMTMAQFLVEKSARTYDQLLLIK